MMYRYMPSNPADPSGSAGPSDTERPAMYTAYCLEYIKWETIYKSGKKGQIAKNCRLREKNQRA